jgi:hypothetical protein
MSDILNKILAVKREEVAAARAVVSDAAVRELAAAQPPRGISSARSAPRSPPAARR